MTSVLSDPAATTLSDTLISAFLHDEIQADSLPDPAWGPLGKVVYERTYSRDIYLVRPDGTLNLDDAGNPIPQAWWSWSLPEGGRTKEVWAETCRRVTLGSLSHDTTLTEVEREAEAVELFEHLFTFKITPAGRHLWVTGTGSPWSRNCWSAPFGPRTSDHFRFGAMRLFEGGGVGSNYSDDQLALTTPLDTLLQLSISCNTEHKDFSDVAAAVNGTFAQSDSRADERIVVEDSREGWVAAWCQLIDLAMSGRERVSVIMDVSQVRPFGAPLKTFGGTASGPAPLVGASLKMVETLNAAASERRRLRGLEAMDIDHEIAAAVVAGGARRSARMSLMSWNSPEIFSFISCKADFIHHWTTNISVEIDNEFREALAIGDPHATKVYEAVCAGIVANGEPGMVDTGVINSTRNTSRGNDVRHVNPCALGSTKLLTDRGLVRIDELAGTEFKIWNGVSWTDSSAWSTGVKPVFEVTLSSGEKITTTADHRFMTANGDEMEAKDLLEVRIRPFLAQGWGDGSECTQEAFDAGRRVGVETRGADSIPGWLFTAHPGVVGAFIEGIQSDYGSITLGSDQACRDVAMLISALGWGAPIIDNGTVDILPQEGDYGDVWTVVSVEPVGEAEVFDFHEPERHWGWANGFQIHNCGEATLETRPGSLDEPGSGESCNLGHVNLDAFGTDLKGALRAFELVGRFLYRATLNMPTEEAAARIERDNRRIGAGIYGFQGWLAAHGTKMSEFPEDTNRQTDLRAGQAHAYAAACDVADRNGTPHPISATVIAPTGSIAQLSGATAGINPVYSPYFIRRVRFGLADPAWGEAQAQGYTVEKDIYADNTMVVEYPTRDAILDRFDEELIEGSFDIDFGTYMRIVAAVQTSLCGGELGQAVSHTAQLEPNTDPVELADALRPLLGTIKGVTAFPAISRPMSPLEAITREEMDEYARFREIIVGDSNDGACSPNGACPVR